MSDKNEVLEFLKSLEIISNKINIEIKRLKKRLKFQEIRPELHNYHEVFYQNVLIPLFKTKKIVTFEDIIEKSIEVRIKKLSENTIKCYLSTLLKHNYLEFTLNKKDKRRHLYRSKE